MINKSLSNSLTKLYNWNLYIYLIDYLRKGTIIRILKKDTYDILIIVTPWKDDELNGLYRIINHTVY